MAGNGSPEEATIDSLKEEIHAVLCTVKGSVPSEQLMKDYNAVCGTPLPYRKFGYNNINELLKSIPDVVACQYHDGNLFVRAIPKNVSAHINKLVQGQKAPKKPHRMVMQSSYNSQRGRIGFTQSAKPRPLLKNPVHPNALNKNGTQNRPAAPWNAPIYYQSAPMRSLVVVPPNSTVRQVIAPKSQPPATSQQAPPTRQQTVQPSQLQQQPQQQQQQQKSPNAQQPYQPYRPPHAQKSPASQVQLQAPQAPPSMRPPRPTVPPLPIVKSNNFHREKLQRFVLLHGLGDITYEHSKLKHHKYVATVIVDKRKSSCYPDEFSTIEEAYEKAAEVALSELESKYQEAVKRMPVTKDDKVMAKRVVDIVSKYTAGCWSEAFVKIYAEDYKESLPEDWVQRVQSITDEVEFTAVLENFLVCLAPAKKAPEFVSSTPVVQSKPLFNESISDLLMQPMPRIIESQVSAFSAPEECDRPALVQYTDSAFWVVHILVIRSGDMLAVRRIDSEQYVQWEELMNEMDLFYSENEGKLSPVKSMEPGRLYAAPVDGLWARVELAGNMEDGFVEVSLVDYADTEKLKISSIFPLEPRFKNLPCQGLMCNLHGLSSFASSEVAISAEIERLLNGQFIAHVIAREPQLSIILYDSSSGNQLNMNEWILDQVAEKTASIPLKVGPVVQNSVISYVSSACDVYMLRDTPQQNLVHALVSLVALRAEDTPTPAALTANAIYLGRSEKHGWCRMKLYSNIPTHDGNVSVQLMDYGDTELVPGNTLRELQSLSPVLARLPEQAIRVLLARVPPSPTKVFTEKAAQTLRQIAPPELSLMVRVLEFNNGVPVVELFERLDSGKLVTINASLEMNEALYRSTEQVPQTQSALLKARLDSDMSQRVAALTLPSRRSSLSSSPSPTFQMERVIVPEADIPPVDTGRFLKPFDVFVINVSNPGHFYVQPLQTFRVLGSLMHRLKEVCSREDVKSAKMDAASVIDGGYYAGWHSKSESYRRVKVTGKTGGSVGVHYIDYGEIDVIPINCIRPLPAEFADFPAQAMRAQLFGVKPANGDWSPQNALFFKKFVDGKVFASYVMGVLPDKILCLQLIDLSGKEDLVVAKYLIDNCHAIAA